MKTRFCIPDECIKEMCQDIERFIRPDHDDARIQRHLQHVRLTVHKALLEDPEVIERLADRDEFKANVEREGEKEVIELLRNTAKAGSWLDLFENSTCLLLLTRSAAALTVFCIQSCFLNSSQTLNPSRRPQQMVRSHHVGVVGRPC